MNDDHRLILLIINPNSGSTDPSKLEHLADEYRQRYSRKIRTLHLKDDTDLKGVVTEYKQNGYHEFWVAGGDGTIDSVASVIDPQSDLIGIIPGGTGNMIGKVLKIPENPKAAMEILLNSKKTILLDAMNVNGKVGFLQVSCGLSSKAIRQTSNTDKSRLGILAYIWAGLKAFKSVRPQTYMLSIDGKKQSIKAIEVVIANIGSIGDSNVTFTETVDPTDKKLDIFIVPDQRINTITRAIHGLFDKQSTYWKSYSLGQSKSITINSKVTIPVQMDGDEIGQTPISIQISSQQYRFIAQ
ncbi:hypothetical protein HGA91_03325 [candidate division WWE3 bacterium]|nr:hypothetical protein [candidate division WWE3 bacterium]